MKPLYSLFSLFVLLSLSGFSQVEVSNSQSVSYLVQEVFQGQGVSVTNITFNGLSADSISDQVGAFSSNGGYLEIENGIVMSTGGVIGADFNGDTVIVGVQTTMQVSNSMGGDADLMQISNQEVNDQAIIEFDIVPEFGFLLYDYQFGSEEYPEFVNSFNDAFGMFISGPGLSGAFSSPVEFPDGSVNMAIVPGSEVAVSIDNVNNGNFNCPGPAPGPCMNCDYYIDNCEIADEAMDGITVPLTAAAAVQAGETYHIKMAIGDALDSAWDSAIFLMEQSLRSVAQLPTAIPEFVDRSIMVARNPMLDFLVLSDVPEEMKTFELRDINGRVAVQTTSITSPMMRTEVSHLDKGIYILLLSDANGQSWVQRVVKE